MKHQPKKCLFFVIIALILLTIGCQGAKKKDQPIHYTPDSQFNPEYKTVFKLWTREDRIYKGFDCKLIATATYKSIQFRKAYTREYSQLYRLNAADEEKFYKDQENAADTYNEFIFAAYVPEKKWDDFQKEKSTWKIYLRVDDGAWITPVEIRKLERNNVVLKHFFPYVTPWKSVYLVRFPSRHRETGETLVGDMAGTLTFSVSSVLGSAEMAWDLSSEKEIFDE